MRTLIMAIMASGALGLAGAAAAQQSVDGPNQMPNIPQGGGGPYGMNVRGNAADERYDNAIMMLKKKMDRLTREDGGKLTPEHQTSLNAELDRVNVEFGRKAKPAQRGSFGHHEPAPGGNSAS